MVNPSVLLGDQSLDGCGANGRGSRDNRGQAISIRWPFATIERLAEPGTTMVGAGTRLETGLRDLTPIGANYRSLPAFARAPRSWFMSSCTARSSCASRPV